MSPSFAVPISGAAVDSHNVTQGLLVDAVLDLFDADLGYFVNGWSTSWHPDPAGRSHSRARSFADRLGFYVPRPFVNQMVESHRRTAGAKRYLLMNGGIFDNVGIYALIRRRRNPHHRRAGGGVREPALVRDRVRSRRQIADELTPLCVDHRTAQPATSIVAAGDFL